VLNLYIEEGTRSQRGVPIDVALREVLIHDSIEEAVTWLQGDTFKSYIHMPQQLNSCCCPFTQASLVLLAPRISSSREKKSRVLRHLSNGVLQSGFVAVASIAILTIAY